MSTAVVKKHSFYGVMGRLRDHYRRGRLSCRLRFSKDPEKLKMVLSELEHWFYSLYASMMHTHQSTGLTRYAEFLLRSSYPGGSFVRLNEMVSSSRLELEFSSMEALQRKLHELREAVKHGLTCAICLGSASTPSVCLQCHTIVGCYECCVQAAEAAVKRNVIPKCPLCRGDWYLDPKRNVLKIRGLQEMTNVAFGDEEE
uniref:RING-type domain-containing protein n=1 Tax=Plectus sambesii TaxID=2011161 RepID=A0A914XRW8_9BILA